ncbi:hypothetical protein COY62_00170 [bacterium (Candidatus Howlettbacteria) CG_4_10_14_0_8_um_filter_40_9]|nr:MAG: hypothetical protein COY62_00170 [bacterium (Candidatus Howlettbacteria) CG_4_10_14_0_8_um_filter_40_9]
MERGQSKESRDVSFIAKHGDSSFIVDGIEFDFFEEVRTYLNDPEALRRRHEELGDDSWPTEEESNKKIENVIDVELTDDKEVIRRNANVIFIGEGVPALFKDLNIGVMQFKSANRAYEFVKQNRSISTVIIGTDGLKSDDTVWGFGYLINELQEGVEEHNWRVDYFTALERLEGNNYIFESREEWPIPKVYNSNMGQEKDNDPLKSAHTQYLWTNHII